MTPLRQKMIDLMTFRQYAPKTCQVYLRAVIHFKGHSRGKCQIHPNL